MVAPLLHTKVYAGAVVVVIFKATLPLHGVAQDKLVPVKAITGSGFTTTASKKVSLHPPGVV